METNKLLLVIICILLPPVAVFIKFGFGGQFIINLILTLLFFIPGMVHALWLVLK
ncbi:YqaE/Pmp3 family membrane protein [Vibrio sp. FNV 38]|nr:YqaE/Pmp3 family membrane protein [Vibrio sp. FNV 38]